MLVTETLWGRGWGRRVGAPAWGSEVSLSPRHGAGEAESGGQGAWDLGEPRPRALSPPSPSPANRTEAHPRPSQVQGGDSND